MTSNPRSRATVTIHPNAAFGWPRSIRPRSHCPRATASATRPTVTELADRLDSLQRLFYADGRYKLLVVLQGMDTSGKDGTLRDVFGAMSPLGLRTVGVEGADRGGARARLRGGASITAVPGNGRARGLQPQPLRGRAGAGGQGPAQARAGRAALPADQRFRTHAARERHRDLQVHAAHLERRAATHACRSGSTTPTKHWKFDVGDLEVRKHWKQYQAAYEAAIAATGTRWAPGPWCLPTQDTPQPDDRDADGAHDA